jgi:hypothetical protein
MLTGGMKQFIILSEQGQKQGTIGQAGQHWLGMESLVIFSLKYW